MNILSSLLNFIGNKIGNSAMGTTATTLTGAIAEHESDISTIAGKLNAAYIRVAELSGSTLNNVELAISGSTTNYSMLIIEMICQQWSTTYVLPTPYATNVKAWFGFDNLNYCTVAYTQDKLTFKNPHMVSGVTSCNVRVYGIRR